MLTKHQPLFLLDSDKADQEAIRAGADPLMERIADPKAVQPLEATLEAERRERISQALEALPARQAMVLKECFGFRGGGQPTLEEVGEKFGVTGERIRQIKEEALEQLRNFNHNQLHDLL